MDKAQGYIPQFLTGYSGPRSCTSRAFQLLVRGIGEAKSKYEEEKIIKQDYAALRDKFSQPASSKQMREYLLRLIYCEMLGVDSSAFHIHAINFAQQRNLHDKRIGYLALSIFLHENHSLILLLINTLQRDLSSTNVLEVCYALSAVNKLINAEMVPTVLQQVLALLDNKRDILRKKALMALYTIYQKSPSLVPDISQRATKALNDHDCSVAFASLHILHDLVQADPTKYKNLVPSFVAMQTKIISGKISQEFDFHKIPAPWAQIKLLKILSLLGSYDFKASQQMYDVLQQTLTALNTSTLISFAIAYECTKTIATIYPQQKLKKYVSKCVGLFLVANSNDIKYLGINALTSLIDTDASYAADPSYQRIVIDCLDDPDETLKRKTLDLLCRITNADNVESICERLIKHLKETIDEFFRADLIGRITELAERYAPDNSWYILTMNEVIEVGGDLIQEDVAHNLIRLIAEGSEDEEVEEDLRRFAVISYMDLLDKPVLPDILVQVISWILGEYSYCAPDVEPEFVIEKLSLLLDRNFYDLSTKRWVMTAIGKLMSHMNGEVPSHIYEILDQLSQDKDADVRQRCKEIKVLSKELMMMRRVLPKDSSCEDIEVDESLSFLDAYVDRALESGAHPYIPEPERCKEDPQLKPESKHIEPSLKMTPYELPQRRKVTTTQHDMDQENTKRNEIPGENVIQSETSKRRVKLPKVHQPSSSKELSGIKGPWGPKGYTKSLGSASGDSASMSGSSSKSSGPERASAVKTVAESTPSPSVFVHEDKTKLVVDDIFKGVGNTPTNQTSRRPARGMARYTRPINRNKKPHIRDFDPGDAPEPPPRRYLEKIDLLLDLETGDKLDMIGRETSKELVTVESNVSLTEENTESHIKNDSACELSPHIPNDIEKDHSIPADIEKDPSIRGDIEKDPSIPGDIEKDPSIRGDIGNPTLDVGQVGQKPKTSLSNLLDSDITENTTAPLKLEEFCSNLALPEDLQDFPRAVSVIELCNDANIRVILQKVYKPDQLVLVLYLTNQSQANLPLTNITTVLEPPSNLRGSFDSTNENRFVDPVLEPLSSKTHMVCLNYKSPALHMSLGGKITYKDYTSTLKTLFISTTLPLTDIIRPLQIDTEAFGNHWGETAFEKRKSISSNLSNTQQFVESVEEKLGLKKVDVIDSKVIASGSILQGPLCLLHAIVDNGTLDLRIKTNSELLSSAVIKQCTEIFK